MLKLVEVKTKKEQKDFVGFPNKLYKGANNYVPPLYMDEISLFSSKNMYKESCDDIFFLVYDEKKVVGRIQGIIQNTYNKIHNTKICRFTRFDSINDINVSNMLFDAILDFAKKKGMKEVIGPLGYSDLEREGLLIEGFDERETFEEQYNFPYYQELVEKYGFEKDIDWVESELKLNKVEAEKIMKASNLAYKRYKLKRIEKNKHESNSHFIERVKDKFFYLLDEGYKNIYGAVPFSDSMKEQVIKEFKLLIDPKYIKIIADENDNPVAFAMAFPHISDIMVGTDGKLTPSIIIKLIKRVKKPQALDLGLVAVDPSKAMSGVVAPIIATLVESFEEYDILFMETNLNLEDNTGVRNLWNHFDSREHKRRRAYKINIVE